MRVHLGSHDLRRSTFDRSVEHHPTVAGAPGLYCMQLVDRYAVSVRLTTHSDGHELAEASYCGVERNRFYSERASDAGTGGDV